MHIGPRYPSGRVDQGAETISMPLCLEVTSTTDRNCRSLQGYCKITSKNPRIWFLKQLPVVKEMKVK